VNFEIPATGRQAVMIYKFRYDKVAQQWAAEDWTGILAQIGDAAPPWARS
jgi:predicted ester cyclase